MSGYEYPRPSAKSFSTDFSPQAIKPLACKLRLRLKGKLPRATHDARIDGYYVYLSNEPVARTVTVREGEIFVDYDAEGRPVGVEVLA